MFLTLDIIKNNNSCESGVKWFERHFPQGGELIDVINHKYVPIDFIHWGYNNLHLFPLVNEEEKNAYLNKLKINCKKPWTITNSYDILNSSNILKSKHIENSKYIMTSNNVINSSMIQASSDIINSNNIFNSSDIIDSNQIYVSKNITQSKDIAFSTDIIDSYHILNSETIRNSFFIIGNNENKTINIENSYFISNSKNLSQCLFCTEIENEELLLFNKPITKNEFKQYKMQLFDILNNLSLNFTENWENTKLPLKCPTIKNQELWYQNIPNSLLEWIQTLPNYNKIILDKIILH